MPNDRSPAVSTRKLLVMGLIGLCVAGGVVVNGLVARARTDTKLKSWADAQSLPTVAVVYPERTETNATLDLPGRLEALSRAPIFGRVSGYVKSWSADMGAAVKAGQVIAEIEAPDLDQQLLQGRADLARAESAAKLSEATLLRRKSLVASNFVSAQEIDERTADLEGKRGAVDAARANVERLDALAGFKKITVPFDGIVTARNTDVGALISGGVGTGPAMFVISDVHRLRVFVNVPQAFVPSIKLGTTASITLPEYPGRQFTATVESSSQAVDPASGTTRMQLLLDNAKGELMPGGYANVKLSPARESGLLTVPSSALIFGRSGIAVATVAGEGRVTLKPVTIARDFGRTVEIASGLSEQDLIVPMPPDGLLDGEKVRVTRTPERKGGKPTAETKPADSKG